MCCNTEQFKLSGDVTTQTASKYADSDFRLTTEWNNIFLDDPIYSEQDTSGNPFVNNLGYSLLQESVSVFRPGLYMSPLLGGGNGSYVQLAKPTHCYIVYEYNDTYYRLDCLTGNCSTITPTITWVESDCALYAAMDDPTDRDLKLRLPKITFSAPFHVAGDLTATLMVNLYDGSNLTMLSNEIVSTRTITFTNLMNGAVLPTTVIAFAEYETNGCINGRPINSATNADCTLSWAITPEGSESPMHGEITFSIIDTELES